MEVYVYFISRDGDIRVYLTKEKMLEDLESRGEKYIDGNLAIEEVIE